LERVRGEGGGAWSHLGGGTPSSGALRGIRSPSPRDGSAAAARPPPRAATQTPPPTAVADQTVGREFRWSRYWPLEPFLGGADHVLREGLVREVGVEDTVGHLKENVKSLTSVASTQGESAPPLATATEHKVVPTNAGAGARRHHGAITHLLARRTAALVHRENVLGVVQLYAQRERETRSMVQPPRRARDVR